MVLPQSPAALKHLKMQGFSDAQLALVTGDTEDSVRSLRHKANIRPVYKRIDTCAAEFRTETAYMYGCYEGLGFKHQALGENSPPNACECSPYQS